MRYGSTSSRQVSLSARPARKGPADQVWPGRRGFTLIEMVIVVSMLATLLLLIAATLWGAVRIERADAALLHRITTQAQLADQFRQDVSRSLARSSELGDTVAGPECLILHGGGERYIVYRWSGGRLLRREIAGATESARTISVGGEHVTVEFPAPADGSRVVMLRLVEIRGKGTSRRPWPLEICAALRGDLQ